jgi:protein-S-isoprenylcysteine O-methyltransferase Ste14
MWSRLPVPAIYALFGVVLAGIGTLLLFKARSSALRGAQLGAVAAAIATVYAFLVRGSDGLGLMLLDGLLKSEPHDLQRFGGSIAGFALTAIGFVCFCGLLTGASRTLFSGRWLVGAFAVLLLCYWAFCWHQMAHAFWWKEVSKQNDEMRKWNEQVVGHDNDARTRNGAGKASD